MKFFPVGDIPTASNSGILYLYNIHKAENLFNNTETVFK
ncbi:hypothetical protein M8044_000547 [Columbia Basin potato purple top phytoplasma]|uniref:Uncharacterized protein n=1 Tax=Columbia Basin potato purple top phytoplasma TaxID=307134 RepID=A0ABT5L9Q4_9MOLU|nr:hypothetical protein [Columbia Basin potato purple top phytoplasma]